MTTDTLIDHRKAMWQALFTFQKLLDDEDGKEAFQPIMAAFSAFDDKVKTVLDTPQILRTIENNDIFEFHEAAPSVQPTEITVNAATDDWIELENGDLISLKRIDCFKATEGRILFSSGKWTPKNMVSTKDGHLIKYAIKLNLFKS